MEDKIATLWLQPGKRWRKIRKKLTSCRATNEPGREQSSSPDNNNLRRGVCRTMKKSLYEILGVAQTASKEEIEAAYSARIDELKFATLQDPNKLRVLQQSREVLADVNRRATYDASLMQPEGVPRAAPRTVARAAPPDDASFLQKKATWIALAALAVIVIAVWALRGTPPVLQAVKPVAVKKVQPVVPADSAPRAVVVQAPVAAPAAPVQSAADLAAEPVMGNWDCADAISGRTTKYAFREGGALAVTSPEGMAEYKYEFSGRTLTIDESGKTTTLNAEELGARKMILNTGAAGRRIVCKR
jgi:hypothetical protein